MSKSCSHSFSANENALKWCFHPSCYVGLKRLDAQSMHTLSKGNGGTCGNKCRWRPSIMIPRQQHHNLLCTIFDGAIVFIAH